MAKLGDHITVKCPLGCPALFDVPIRDDRHGTRVNNVASLFVTLDPRPLYEHIEAEHGTIPPHHG